MKCCPSCGANVEGLVHYCDCCGATLTPRNNLFHRICYSVQECFGLSKYSDEILEKLEPVNSLQFSDFLDRIDFELVCYPDSLLEAGNVKEKVFFSAKRKLARITVVVGYHDYIFADNKGKEALVARSMHRGIQMLQGRLKKYKLSIEDLVSRSEEILRDYDKNKTLQF